MVPIISRPGPGDTIRQPLVSWGRDMVSSLNLRDSQYTKGRKEDRVVDLSL